MVIKLVKVFENMKSIENFETPDKFGIYYVGKHQSLGQRWVKEVKSGTQYI